MSNISFLFLGDTLFPSHTRVSKRMLNIESLMQHLKVALVDNRRPGNLVLLERAAPDVDENARVRGTVCSRNLDSRWELSAIASGNLDLLMVGSGQLGALVTQQPDRPKRTEKGNKKRRLT